MAKAPQTENLTGRENMELTEGTDKAATTQVEIIFEEARLNAKFPEFSKVFRLIERLFPQELSRIVNKPFVSA